MQFRIVTAAPLILSITALILSASLYGCGLKTSLVKEKTTPAITDGAIMVDSPEVFTKQRLLDQHQQEVQWLSQKLSEYTPGGYQGIRDVRILATEAQIALAEIKHEVAELEKEVENLEEEISEKQAETPQEAEDAGQQKPKEPPSEKSAAEPPVPASGLLSPQMYTKTEAELTHIEKVRDEMACRQMIHAALRAREVNDTNELMGYRLYTLKFDSPSCRERIRIHWGRYPSNWMRAARSVSFSLKDGERICSNTWKMKPLAFSDAGLRVI